MADLAGEKGPRFGKLDSVLREIRGCLHHLIHPLHHPVDNAEPVIYVHQRSATVQDVDGKVIGGWTPTCAELAGAFYASAIWYGGAGDLKIKPDFSGAADARRTLATLSQ